MRILIEITHPAHVHFFRNAIKKFEQFGHIVAVTAREKDITTQLLENYKIPFTTLSTMSDGRFSLFGEMAVRCLRLLKFCGEFKPDVIAAIAGTFAAPVGKLIRTPVIIFYDTENATVSNTIAFPLATAVITPACYRKRVRKNHITYNGYHELAYLHPKYFTPDPSILNLLGVEEGEKFVIMRFVSWGAAHDVGHEGISLANKKAAVREFSKYGKVFITSEKPLPDELEKYRITIPPEKIFDALYYATLLYGESATMASECAVLGTPAIYLDNVGRGYTYEQEYVYRSVFNFSESPIDQQESIALGVRLLQRDDLKKSWAKKRVRILREKIDVTKLIVSLVEHCKDVPEAL